MWKQGKRWKASWRQAHVVFQRPNKAEAVVVQPEFTKFPESQNSAPPYPITLPALPVYMKQDRERHLLIQIHQYLFCSFLPHGHHYLCCPGEFQDLDQGCPGTVHALCPPRVPRSVSPHQEPSKAGQPMAASTLHTTQLSKYIQRI